MAGVSKLRESTMDHQKPCVCHALAEGIEALRYRLHAGPGDIHPGVSSRPQMGSGGGVSLQTAAMRLTAGTGSRRWSGGHGDGPWLTARATC